MNIKRLLSTFFFASLFFGNANPVFALSPLPTTTPAFQTDFEQAVKVDENTLNLPINHWFEFGDYDGSSNGDGARMWVETSKAHSGTKSIGLEVSNITRSRRAEFDIFPSELTGNELSVSQWLFFPANFGLHAPNIDWNWHNFLVLNSEYEPGNDQYLDLTLIQQDITKPNFQLTLGGRKAPAGSPYILQRLNSFNLPRGRWFNVHTYIKRDPVHGAAKVWIDGQLIFDHSEINVAAQKQNFHITPAKVYYETTDNTLQQLWIDDLKIYKGYVPPAITSSPLPTTSPILVPSPSPVFCQSDLNKDGIVNVMDYSLLVKNFFNPAPQPPGADINKDGVVNIIDFSVLSSQFFKKC